MFSFVDLSIHDLTRRSTLLFGSKNLLHLLFQFTTSQGGRRGLRSIQCHRVPFNSRPHKEVDTRTGTTWADIISFNSRPHKEVDPGSTIGGVFVDLSIHDLTRRSTDTWLTFSAPRQSFNSRPHKEVDTGFPVPEYGKVLSIHDLTRRSTRTIGS